MNKHKERLHLVTDMIAFAIVDGKLHPREYQFIELVAGELQIGSDELKQLFHQEHYPEVIQSEFERIQQFYRLALLMHCDGVLHQNEQNKIREIGIAMGLNPNGIKRVLQAMEISPTGMISPEFLLDVFQEQYN
jgi:uncharacterized tellurite resistance protein B-like protein